jgi:hypothetical protein
MEKFQKFHCEYNSYHYEILGNPKYTTEKMLPNGNYSKPDTWLYWISDEEKPNGDYKYEQFSGTHCLKCGNYIITHKRFEYTSPNAVCKCECII